MKPKYEQGSGIGFADIHPHRSQLDRETWIVDMSNRRHALAEAMDYTGLLELAQEYADQEMTVTAHQVRKQAGRVAQRVYEKVLENT